MLCPCRPNSSAIRAPCVLASHSPITPSQRVIIMSGTLTALARTLDQELVALARGASLACPVCSEFVLHVRGAYGLAIACPECRSILAEGHEVPEIALPSAAQTG